MTIQEKISIMTLEEKASLCSGVDFWHSQPIERLGIPALMLSDGPHGLRKQDDKADHLGVNESIKAVCFPNSCATAASFDRDAVRQIGEAIGDTCQNQQVAVALGPAVNIKRSPLCGRNFEYFSEDPFLAAQLTQSYIRGLQSRHIAASVKHFAANSQEHRRMSSDSVVDERTLREIYFPAFEAAVREGKTKTVMCSYNKLNGTFASQNPWLLTRVLRDEWGFDGYVVSDWGATSDRVKALEAGMDLEMPSSAGENDKKIVEAVRAGLLDEAVLDRAVERILRVHEDYLENARPDTPWDMEAQHALARRIAAECMVLLKNEGGLLPLAEGEDIAVIGLFAKKPRYQGGGSSHINSFRVSSLMDALDGLGGVRYAQGYDIDSEEPDEAMISEAVELARRARSAVIVAGLPDSFESEGYDRSHLRMPACQNELIERVAAVNSRVTVVLYNGSPVEMPWLDRVSAVIEGYLGGQAVGEATRDVLFGLVNPSGRLPESFPMRLEDSSCFLSYGGEGNRAEYREGVFVGYRYYDKKKTQLLFPFGWGLSYTRFAYGALRLDKNSMKDTDTLRVSVDVTNTGSRAGKEVVQLYVADCESSVFRPLRELKGFEKVSLAPGETKTVHFELDKRAFAYWHSELGDWYVESGEFRVQICANSREVLLEAPVRVEGTVRLPVTYTMDSIVVDLMADPRAARIMASLGPLTGALPPAAADEGLQSEVSTAAISPEMMAAMLRYSPLRSLVAFSGGAMSFEDLEKLLALLNSDAGEGEEKA